MIPMDLQVRRNFPLPERFFSDISSASPPEIVIELDVHLGVIADVTVRLPFGLLDKDFYLSDAMHGMRFGRELPASVGKVLTQVNDVASVRVIYVSCHNV